MHPDEQARLSKLAVTPNPVEVREHQFVAPQPHIDWRELNPPSEHDDKARRIRHLERRVQLLEDSLSLLLKSLAAVGKISTEMLA